MPDNWRLFVYRQLIVLVGLLSLAGTALSASGWPFFFVVVAVLLASGFGLICGDLKAAIALGLIPLAFWFYTDWRQNAAHADDVSKWKLGRLVTLEAIVEEPPCLDARGFSQLIVRVQQIVHPQEQKTSGRCLIRFAGKLELEAGDQIEAKVLLDKPQNRHEAWEFNQKEYLRKYGIGCSAWLKESSKLRLIKHGERDRFDGLREFVATSRKHLVDTHCRYVGETEGALLTSMVIGDRAVNLPNEITQQFRDVGLSHVLAASGFNLTIVSGCTLFLVRLFLKPLWCGNIACLLTMLSFVVMAGPSPSVLRSALMLCVVLFCRTFARKASMATALSVAIVVSIVVDPACITDVGFQLSYVATAAIMLGAEQFGKLFARAGKLFGVAEAASVIVIAQMGVLPIQLYYFWCVGLFFLPANLLVAPLVHLVTLSGFASSLIILFDRYLGWFGGLIWLIDKISSYPLTAILLCVRYLASFENAKVVLGAPHILCLIFYYLTFLALVISLKIGRFRVLSSCLVIGAICLLAWRPGTPCTSIAFFKNSVACLRSDNRAVVLGNANVMAVKKFLLYHGVRQIDCKDGPEVFIPEDKLLIVRVDEETFAKGSLPPSGKCHSVILAIKGPRFRQLIDALSVDKQFAGYVEEGKTIWLVPDRGISKKAEMALLNQLPSCVKIASHVGESLVIEATNGSIKVRN